MFFYKSHTGGVYACNRFLLEDELTCCFCEGKDRLLGYAENIEDAEYVLKKTTKHDYNYIQTFVYWVFAD